MGIQEIKIHLEKIEKIFMDISLRLKVLEEAGKSIEGIPSRVKTLEGNLAALEEIIKGLPKKIKKEKEEIPQ